MPHTWLLARRKTPTVEDQRVGLTVCDNTSEKTGACHKGEDEHTHHERQTTKTTRPDERSPDPERGRGRVTEKTVNVHDPLFHASIVRTGLAGPRNNRENCSDRRTQHEPADRRFDLPSPKREEREEERRERETDRHVNELIVQVPPRRMKWPQNIVAGGSCT